MRAKAFTTNSHATMYATAVIACVAPIDKFPKKS
jgi:hypothetical protein